MEEPTLKEKTAKGLFWGSIGFSGQQVLYLGFMIFLGRLLDESDFGMIGMLAIFTAIGSALLDSGFTAGLINRKIFRNEDYNAVFWFSLGMGAVLYTILFFCAPIIAAFFKEPALTNLSRFLFLSILFGSMGTAHNAVLMKKLMVKERAKADILSILISGIVSVTMAFKGMAYWGLATQIVLASFISNIIRWYYSPWNPSFSFEAKPLREMFPFSVKLLATALVAQFSLNIISLLTGRYYTKSEVGFYSQGNKWANAGSSLLTSIIRGVALPVFAEVTHDIDRQRTVFRKMLRFTAFLSFPAMLGLALVARELIIITVTDKWLPAVPIMQMICFMAAVLPISTLYAQLIMSCGRSAVQLYSTIGLGMVQISAIYLALPYGIYYMTMAFTVINILWVFVWHFYAWQCIKISLWDALKDVCPYMLIAAGVMVVTYLVTMPLTNIYLLFIAKIMIATLLYGSIMRLTNSVIFKECIDFFMKKKIKR